jgi:hypothetical protein
MGRIVDACVRQYAFEGQVFVISCAAYMNKDMVPDWFELKEGTYWDCAGGSSIVSPLGDYLAEPIYDREEIVCAELDFDRIIEAKLVVDSTGHYSRPDVLSLNINTEKYSPIRMPNRQGPVSRDVLDATEIQELTAWARGNGSVARDIIALIADGHGRLAPPRSGEAALPATNGTTIPRP